MHLLAWIGGGAQYAATFVFSLVSRAFTNAQISASVAIFVKTNEICRCAKSTVNDWGSAQSAHQLHSDEKSQSEEDQRIVRQGVRYAQSTGQCVAVLGSL